MTAPKRKKIEVIPLTPKVHTRPSPPPTPEPELFQDRLPALDHELLSREASGWWRSNIALLGRVGVNPELFAFASLGAVATAAQECALVKGHTSAFLVDLNLWGVCLAPPGSGKSVAFEHAFEKPLQRVRAMTNAEPSRLRSQAQKEITRRRREEKKLRDALEKLDVARTTDDSAAKPDLSKKIEERLAELDGELLSLYQSRPRIKVDIQPDATAEAINNRVHEVERFAIASDELSDTLTRLHGHQENAMLGTILGLYDGRVPVEQLRVRDQRNAADRGDPMTVRDRAFSHARATFCGFAQPSTATTFGDHSGRGLTSRMVFLCRPEHTRRSLEEVDVDLDGSEAERYINSLAALVRLPSLRDKAKPVLFLGEDALARFGVFYEQIEDARAPGGSLSTSLALQEWGARLAQQALRLAGIFALTDQLDRSDQVRLEGVRVSGDQMERAVLIARVLIPHAQFFFGGLAESPESRAGRRLLERMRSARAKGMAHAFKPGDIVSRREVGRKIHASEDDLLEGPFGPKRRKLECAWDELVSRDILLPVDDSRTFRLNPHPRLQAFWDALSQDTAGPVTPNQGAVTPLSTGCHVEQNEQPDRPSAPYSQELASKNEVLSRQTEGVAVTGVAVPPTGGAQ